MMEQAIATYREEAGELLAELETSLLDLEETPDDNDLIIHGSKVGFVVDHVVGEHQTVIKSLGKMYRDVKGVSGATILGDGTVALILDMNVLLQNIEQMENS
jgi:two-component system chemotaxis sensor kinase CheA